MSMKQKWFAVLLLALLCSLFAACGAQTDTRDTRDTRDVQDVQDPAPKGLKLVTDALDLATDLSSGYRETENTVYVQDPMRYLGGSMSCKESLEHGYTVFSFTGGKEELELFERYVEDITREGHNLTLSDRYYEEYPSFGASFFSWMIDYSGTGSVTSTMEDSYTHRECTLVVQGTTDNALIKTIVCIPLEMEIVDLGLRYNGENTDGGRLLVGQSLAAGLYQNGSGDYSTTDGRLSCSLGRATVLHDGELLEGSAVMRRTNTIDKFTVKDFYRDEELYLALPARYFMEGDILAADDLASSDKYLRQDAGWLEKGSDRFSSMTYCPLIAMHRNGRDVCAVKSDDTVFRAVTVRFLHVEEEKETVVYLCMEFENEPQTIEALMCVPLEESDVHADAQSTSSDSAGKLSTRSKCLFCDNGWDTCKACGGSGRVERFVSGKWQTRDCSACNGHGGKSCLHCGGDGWTDE